MSKRLLILYTGGTIGMQHTEKGLAPAPDLAANISVLIGPGRTLASDPPQFSVQTVDPLIDSSDMRPGNWIELAGRIESVYDQYDGFVVLHGTDTLAYTSSALSFFIQKRGKPVIVTGAQLPFGYPRSDARSNLISAVEVAATLPEHLAQVCVVFGSRILRGNRATKISARAYDAFASPRVGELGRIGIDIEFQGQQGTPLPLPVNARALSVPADDAVVLLRLYPGISANILRLICQDTNLQALIIEAYGSGNGPVSDPAFTAAIREAIAKGIVVLVVSQPLDGVVHFDRYAAAHEFAGAGAVSGLDITPEAAVTKLYYLIAAGYDSREIKDILSVSLAGEMHLPS
ncbi:asparaginase [Pseudohongiella nitratireducens]|uniref:asparaginase n=1 Tax=Pseudohongiella nitratireducens TaxID=1768907 RepID=UPI0030EDD7A4|tara:strand:+ start:8313 stop:9350 length:1038 start_codon:yes stop_codon:yes gene_type:complete